MAVIMNVVGLFMALLFALFTIIMFSDQLSCIMNNTSTIDKLKKNIDEKNVESSWDLIKEVFGGDFSLMWFVPFNNNAELTVESQY